MNFDQVRKLTWHQYASICRHPRDEKGRLVPRIADDGKQRLGNQQERQFWVWRTRWGWTRERCEMKWIENTELMSYRMEQGQLGLTPEELDRRVTEKTLSIIQRRRKG